MLLLGVIRAPFSWLTFEEIEGTQCICQPCLRRKNERRTNNYPRLYRQSCSVAGFGIDGREGVRRTKCLYFFLTADYKGTLLYYNVFFLFSMRSTGRYYVLDYCKLGPLFCTCTVHVNVTASGGIIVKQLLDSQQCYRVQILFYSLWSSL